MDPLLIAALGIAAATFLGLFLWQRQTAKWLARLLATSNTRDDGHDPDDLPYGASGGGHRPAGTRTHPADEDGDWQ